MARLLVVPPKIYSPFFVGTWSYQPETIFSRVAAIYCHVTNFLILDRGAVCSFCLISFKANCLHWIFSFPFLWDINVAAICLWLCRRGQRASGRQYSDMEAGWGPVWSHGVEPLYQPGLLTSGPLCEEERHFSLSHFIFEYLSLFPNSES